MRWYIPSWNGDYRLDPNGENACVLVVTDPTPAEKEVIVRFLSYARERKWTSRKRLATRSRETRIPLAASVTQVAPVLIDSGGAPKIGALTVLKFSNGEMTATEDPAAAAQAAEDQGEKAKAAATVKRPTSCCPSCIPGSTEPATEVLLEFLTPEQHRTWARERYVICYGGLTGHRYAVAHRHSEHARAWGKITRDLTEGLTLHFHDWSVPPEEEVLGALVMLQFRENWVRHEATAFGANVYFKNPFGGFLDGVPDAKLTRALGSMAWDLIRE